jgi:hypothetical protein
MPDAGRFIFFAGLAITVVGALIWLVARAGFRGLPGDVAYEGQNVRVYFPVVTCVVLSILLTAGFWLWRWLAGR